MIEDLLVDDTYIVRDADRMLPSKVDIVHSVLYKLFSKYLIALIGSSKLLSCISNFALSLPFFLEERASSREASEWYL